MQCHKFPPIWTGRKLSFYYIIKQRILSIFGDFFYWTQAYLQPPPPHPFPFNRQRTAHVCLGPNPKEYVDHLDVHETRLIM